MRDSKENQPPATREFTTTHWSVVLSAVDARAPGAPEALAQLCRTYWYPLYAFIRRKGYDCHDAEDLTQSFLVRLTTSDFIQKADPERGRFRSYLLTALNRFVVDEWRTANRQRRGGGQILLSLDAATAEDRYVREPSDLGSPERLYERRWATTLIEQALPGWKASSSPWATRNSSPRSRAPCWAKGLINPTRRSPRGWG